MALYTDEGVVLRTAKLGEADRIITLFTRMHGKVRAVAKGVRRTKSRFGGRLEPFMRVNVLIAEGRSLDVISQAETIAAYASTISTDYDAYMAAGIMAETVDKLLGAEHEPAVDQYRLLIGALHALARQAHPARSIGDSYVLRALALAGWTPRLQSCVVCGTRERLQHLSIPAGGVMCAADRTPEARPLADTERGQLCALLAGDWTALGERPPDARVTRLVGDWAEYYLERPLRSMRV
ncbi:DNA repair protein RecO [Bifidobacterium pullorum subsp. saeculare DSM 6531 = LMG 14934]|uniref:DNA repair protein RecO n=1 Tax=Bifidobacterium pullorum subsp. saeculare DSM 6531 = LMG 14934 TaxID=1437611 RepID=A0A087D0M0_9BIFI|nr:DNA repair protein RecO [Bifidobacterium pullorum]KFI89070.1 DNA repair protein RecO [Bifidobacterium pullorum subsp. saeculare DSM 6531 = LMG 14934]